MSNQNIDLEAEVLTLAEMLCSAALKEGASPIAVIRNVLNDRWRACQAATKRAEEAEARLIREREESRRQIEGITRFRKADTDRWRGLLRASEEKYNAAVTAAREANAIIESVNEAVSDTCAGSPTYAEAIRGLAATRDEARRQLEIDAKIRKSEVGHLEGLLRLSEDRCRRALKAAHEAKADNADKAKLNITKPVGTPMVKTFEETKRTQGIKHNIQELMWEYLHKAAITHEPYDGYNASFEHMVHFLKGCFNEDIKTNEQFNAAMLRDFGSTPPVQDVVIHVALRSSEVTALSELIQDMPDISADAKASILRSLKG